MLDHLAAFGRIVIDAIVAPVDLGQKIRVLIGLPPDHHAIDLFKMGVDLLTAADAAVENDFQLREILLQPVDPVVIERRDGAVFLGAEAGEPCLARMDDEGLDTHRLHGRDKAGEMGVAVEIVNADPRLHGDGEGSGRLHRRHAGRDRLRLRHQASAETAILHPVRRTADIEVDLLIAVVFRNDGAFCERVGIAPAELERQRLFRRIEAQEPVRVAMNDRPRRHHLRIEQRMGTDQAQEIPVMPIRPVHHRGYAYGTVEHLI